MFRGITNVSLDAKSRMALPTRLREQMLGASGGKVVLTIDIREKCLMLYPLPEWEKVQDKLVALSNLRSDIRTAQRMLMGFATDLELDTQGRVVIPKPLRNYARLERKLVLLGQGNKVEVWSEPHWEERFGDWLDSEVVNSLDDIDELTGFSI